MILGWDIAIKQFWKWRSSAILNFRNLVLWSRDLYPNVIMLLCTTFRVNKRTISLSHWDIAWKRFSLWRPFAILNLQNFDSLSRDRSWNQSLRLQTKFHWIRMILGWYYSLYITQRHLEFSKFDILVTWPAFERDSASTHQISHKSDNKSWRYSQKTIFNMAAVRHIGFGVTSSYYIREHYFTFLTLC